MAHKFSDSTKWQDSWYLNLPGHLKTLWTYLCDNVGESSGVCRLYLPIANAQMRLHLEVTKEDIDQYFKNKVVWISEDKVWLPTYMPYQHKNLSSQSVSHRTMMLRYIELADQFAPDEKTVTQASKYKSLLGLTLTNQGENAVLELKSNITNTDTRPPIGGRSGVDGGSNDPQPTSKDKDKDKEIKEKGGVGGKTLFDFEALLQRYPKRKGSQPNKARQRLEAQIKTPQQAQEFAQALENYAADCEDTGCEQRYIKRFENFVGALKDPDPYWRGWINVENRIKTSKTRCDSIQNAVAYLRSLRSAYGHTQAYQARCILKEQSPWLYNAVTKLGGFGEYCKMNDDNAYHQRRIEQAIQSASQEFEPQLTIVM